MKFRISDSQDPDQNGLSQTFSISETPALTLITPNGGEVWEYDTYATISWSGTNLPYYLIAELSIDGGNTWQYIGYVYSEVTGGTIEISVPFVSTENALLRLSMADLGLVLDQSDAPFTINVPPVIVYYPYEGQTMYQNSSQNISWMSVPGINFINIELSTDNGATWTMVAENEVASNGYYYWTVEGTPSVDCFIRISNASDPSQFGLSARFSILQIPVITINSPSQGDILNTNSTYTITWSYDIPTQSPNVYLQYSVDGGSVWNYLGYGYNVGNEGSFEWTTPVISSDQCLINVSDYYSYNVTDTSEMFTIFTFPQSPICMVSVDSTMGRNVIVWERPATDLIDQFIVYKEGDQADVYEPIGTVNYEDVTVFTDTNSNPAVKPYRYKLGYVDTIGRSYPLSDLHQTIHLSINQGVGNSWNLIWTGYEGFNVASYNIYRATGNSMMEKIATISSSFQSYTDINAPAGTLYYMIEVINPNGCSPEARSGNYNSTFSNKASNQFTSVSEDILSQGIKIYPNPASDNIFIEFNSKSSDNSRILISDISGKTVIDQQVHEVSGTTNINTSELNSGVYFLKFISGDDYETRKFVVRR